MDFEELQKSILNSSLSTKIYIGSDSSRHKVGKVWMAEYTTVVVLHINGNRGCRVFGQIETERDYDEKANKPTTRLMNEVYRTSSMYLKLAEYLQDHEVEIHMDISSDAKHGSSCVLQQAIGYIRGTCNMVPLVKPYGWAASYAADRYNDAIRQHEKVPAVA